MKHQTWLQDRTRREKWVQFLQRFAPTVDPQTVRLLDELAAVARTVHHLGEQSVDETGLSYAQYRVLLHLFFAAEMGSRGELNPSEMSERQGVNRNTMSAFIRSLEEAGLVARALDPDDRRRFNISLTDTGRSLVAHHLHDHLDSIGRCVNGLTGAERETLLRLLQKLGTHAAAEQGRLSS